MSKTKLDCLKLINSIENSAEFKNQILTSKKILIAYSGGQDSSCLLAIFYILSQKWKFHLAVVYCNHGWSNCTKNTLAAFEVLSNYKIPFYFVDTAPGVIQKPENRARQWRYTAFEEIMKRGNYDLLLTGHTLSDKIETIIFNLCRGAGLKGVSSLKTVKTFIKPYSQKRRFNFKYQTMNLADFCVNNSVCKCPQQLAFLVAPASMKKKQCVVSKNFFKTKFINQKNSYKLFSSYIFKCYLKKVFVTQNFFEFEKAASRATCALKMVHLGLPLIALDNFSTVFQTKIQQQQFKKLYILFNLSTYFVKFNTNNISNCYFPVSRYFKAVTDKNILPKKLNFVSQSMCPPKIKQRNFIGAFLSNTSKKPYFNLKNKSFIAFKLKTSLAFSSVDQRAKVALKLKTFHLYEKLLHDKALNNLNCNNLLNYSNITKDSFSIITFFNPATYISARHFLFNSFCFQTKQQFYEVNKVTNSLILPSFFINGNSTFLRKPILSALKLITNFNTNSSSFFNKKFKNLLNKKKNEKVNILYYDCYTKYIKALNFNKNLNCTNDVKKQFYLPVSIWQQIFIYPKSKQFNLFNTPIGCRRNLKTKIKSHFVLYFPVRSFTCAKQLHKAALQSSPEVAAKQLFILSQTFYDNKKFFDFEKKKVSSTKKFDLQTKFKVREATDKAASPEYLMFNITTKIFCSSPIKSSALLDKKIFLNYFNRKSVFNILPFTNSYAVKQQGEFKLRILRPLLKINRSTIFLFTKQLNLTIIFDSSNNDITITRNFIRKKIIPLLKKINPQAEQNFYKFSQIADFYYEKKGHIECPIDLLDLFKP